MKVMDRVMLQALYSISFLIEMAHDDVNDVEVAVRGIYYQLGLLLLLYTIVVYYNA